MDSVTTWDRMRKKKKKVSPLNAEKGGGGSGVTRASSSVAVVDGETNARPEKTERSFVSRARRRRRRDFFRDLPPQAPLQRRAHKVSLSCPANPKCTWEEVGEIRTERGETENRGREIANCAFWIPQPVSNFGAQSLLNLKYFFSSAKVCELKFDHLS